MKLIFILFLLCCSQVFALETDNYLSWSIELDDSGNEINERIKEEILSVLEISNASDDEISCEDITFKIAERFKTKAKRKLFETWSNEHLVHKMYPDNPYYFFQSIYQNSSRFYLRYSGISPNIQTKGIYFGVDKLSHFGSTGRRYLKHYLSRIREGLSNEAALKSAIRYGLSNEASVLGLWPSGVFSYGDMEANYQGFKFYKRFCLDEENSYLKNINGKWVLNSAPEIRDYVNPFWDETFNLSYRTAGIWSRTSLLIKDQYCPLKNSNLVLKRRALYKNLITKKSFSLTYIEELQKLKYYQAPDPNLSQSVDELCEEKENNLM